MELWCGQSQGSICIFVLGEGVVTNQVAVNHYDPIIPGLEVLQMVGTDSLMIEDTIDAFDYEEETSNVNQHAVSGPVVWSYVYPGCVGKLFSNLTNLIYRNSY